MTKMTIFRNQDQAFLGFDCLGHAPAGHDADLLMKSLVLGLQGIQNTYGNDYIILTFKEV